MISTPPRGPRDFFWSERPPAHIYTHMAVSLPVSVNGCFLHSAVGEHGVLESLCLFCGRCTGYSQSEELLALAERAHQCSKRTKLESSPEPAR